MDILQVIKNLRDSECDPQIQMETKWNVVVHHMYLNHRGSSICVAHIMNIDPKANLPFFYLFLVTPFLSFGNVYHFVTFLYKYFPYVGLWIGVIF